MGKCNEKEDKHAAAYPNPFKDYIDISKNDAAFLIQIRIKMLVKWLLATWKFFVFTWSFTSRIKVKRKTCILVIRKSKTKWNFEQFQNLMG